MPIYEYRCEDCGELIERMQRLDEPRLTECPKCGGTLRKQVSAPAFQFKGSGWYVTDYARKGGGKEAGGAEGDGKSEKSTEAGAGAGEGKAGGGSGGSGAETKGSDAEKKPAKAGGGAAD